MVSEDLLYSLPGAATTNDHKSDGLSQKRILSVSEAGVGRALPAGQAAGRVLTDHSQLLVLVSCTQRFLDL